MFRRSSTPPPETTAAVEEEARIAGKGRSTPKRREAEAARKARMTPPRDRKEAAKIMRQKRFQERQKARVAMESGDDRYLPRRDKGPVRKFVRDFVDSRRNVAEYLLPLLVIVLVLSMVQTPWAVTALYVLWMITIVSTIVDTMWLVISMKRELKKRFPDESLRGTTAYAILRSTQIRRFRLPKPQVERGQKLP